MKASNYRDYTRFVLVTFFLTSSGVLFLRRLFWSLSSRSPHYTPEIPTLLIVLLVWAFFFWYAVELYEFFRWNYRVKNPFLYYTLFAARIIPFLIVIALKVEIYSLLLPMFFVVLVFYSSIYFGAPAGIGILSGVLALQIGIDITLNDPFRPPGNTQRDIDLFFLFYKIMNSLLVWLIGYFWKRDRLRWRQNQILTSDLRRTQSQLRKYAEQVTETVVLEERNRLARDIHDSIGHNLTAATIQLTKAEGFFDRDRPTALLALNEARSCIQEGMRDVREVLGTLNEQTGSFDIFSQIRKIIERLPPEQITTEIRLEGDPAEYNKAVLLAVYRLVQEGVTNILKHSEANKVEIRVSLGSRNADIVIKDNGKGFEAEKIKSPVEKNGEQAKSIGFGLEGLRDRISLVRGILHIESEPGIGTLLTAQVPREPSALINGSEYEQHID
ncbi:MAG: sensor histidine kinase [Spirochaetales bacterium]|nr:sensor histidine kinase [Spirochaetales bacterium]MCF7939097.1 sensor histidine kinase [Spirochaetales bacterium]